jgi:hypothetical protein
VLVVPLYGYNFKDHHDINKQVDQLLITKNNSQIKKIAADKKTYDFLTKTKVKRLSGLSDAQGVIKPDNVYYAGRINNHDVNFRVYRDTHNLFRKYFPKYEVLKMSLDANKVTK